MTRSLPVLATLLLLGAQDPARDQIKNKIADELAGLANWCRTRKLLQEGRSHVDEALALLPSHPKSKALQPRLVGESEASERDLRSYGRKRDQVGRSVARYYVLLSQQKHTAKEQKEFDGYLILAMGHDAKRARKAFQARWQQAVADAKWDEVRNLFESLEASKADPEVTLEFLRLIYKSPPPEAQLASFDPALIRMYEKHGEKIGSLFESVWKAALQAEAWGRARQLLMKAKEIQPDTIDDDKLALLEDLEIKEFQAKLVPGGRFTLTFPEFGRTMRGEKTIMQMKVVLPKEYDRKKDYPLFLSLGGGNGSDSPNMGIIGKLPFISIALPYPWDPTRPKARTPHPTILWKPYKAMLARFFRIVTNVHETKRVVFGYSNGAHSITGLVLTTDQEFQKMFPNMVIHEGGMNFGRWQDETWESLKNHRLFFSGGTKSMGPSCRQMCAIAKERGVDAELFIFEGGHTTPKSVGEKVRDWIERKILVD